MALKNWSGPEKSLSSEGARSKLRQGLVKRKMNDFKKLKHIVWYADLEKLDFNNPFVKKWWMEQVLIHGTINEVKKLDFKEIHKMLPQLNLPTDIKSFWEDYFVNKE